VRNHPDHPATRDRPERTGFRRHQARAGLTADHPLADAGLPAIHSTDRRRTPVWHALTRTPLTPGIDRVVRVVVNMIGAASAALFAQASLQFYVHTHRLVGGLFFIEQIWFAVAFLVRRPPRAVSGRIGSWLLAGGGTFGGLLLRPGGAHPPWGVEVGFGLQLAGLAVAIISLLALGRSFGFVAADRGLKTRGPYAVVRHPVYASYLLIQSGYVLQSLSPWNILIFVFASACNIGRALAEENLLARSHAYRAYQKQVRWRLIPYLW
jgi:protein-S-isoprenylcysteine O-methyltransferase Ste14